MEEKHINAREPEQQQPQQYRKLNDIEQLAVDCHNAGFDGMAEIFAILSRYA